MEQLYAFIHAHTEGLYEVIYSSRFFFIDYWSFVHLGSGTGLLLAARAVRLRHVWASLFVILLVYEVLELAFIYLSINVFKPETLPDQLTDIVIGMLGALAATRLPTRPVLHRWASRQLAWLTQGSRLDYLTSFVLAYCWVRYYGYHYNVEFFNSRPVNWWALTLWSFGLYASAHVFRSARQNLGIAAAGLATWLLILSATLVFEYFGYAVLEIRETGGYAPLVLNLIHGSNVLKFCYLFAAPIAIVGSTTVGWTVGRLHQKVRHTAPAATAEGLMQTA